MFYLFVFVAITYAPYSTGVGNPFQPKREWVNQGLFSSEAACINAAAKLGYVNNVSRCVAK